MVKPYLIVVSVHRYCVSVHHCDTVLFFESVLSHPRVSDSNVRREICHSGDKSNMAAVNNQPKALFPVHCRIFIDWHSYPLRPCLLPLTWLTFFPGWFSYYQLGNHMIAMKHSEMYQCF